MNDLQKLEYIHSTIQEAINGYVDGDMMVNALYMVEDIRENKLNTNESE